MDLPCSEMARRGTPRSLFRYVVVCSIDAQNSLFRGTHTFLQCPFYRDITGDYWLNLRLFLAFLSFALARLLPE